MLTLLFGKCQSWEPWKASTRHPWLFAVPFTFGNASCRNRERLCFNGCSPFPPSSGESEERERERDDES